MSALAVLLIAVGVSDLVGGQLRLLGRWNRWFPVAAGVATVAVVGALAGMTDPGQVGLLALSALAVAGWQVTSTIAFARSQRHWLPLLVITGSLTLLLGLAGYAGRAGGPLSRWMTWSDVPLLASVSADGLLLILGLTLVQISTANVVVRLVLSHVGALRPTGPQPSDRLRGGRLLGPMERIVILGLGLAGQLTAASLVIAAKGLIRWPELQKTSASRDHPAFDEREDTVTIDSVTEYFLVGSFVSWVIALAAVAAGAIAGF